MKIKLDIDCTPTEARQLLGFPDLEPMQKELLGELQKRTTKSLELMDPDKLMQSWFTGMSELQGRWGNLVKKAVDNE